MVNLTDIPKNLEFLIKLFYSITMSDTTYNSQLHDATKFNISFFDGTQKRSMRVGWDELKSSVDFLENKLKFDRKPHIQKKYDDFMQQMRDNGNDMTSHILKNEMNIDNENSIGVDDTYVLAKNRFPYDFGNHSHYVLWIHPNCDQSIKSKFFRRDSCEEALKILSKKYPSIVSKRFIIFRNATFNKSVDTIEHFHVIFY